MEILKRFSNFYQMHHYIKDIQKYWFIPFPGYIAQSLLEQTVSITFNAEEYAGFAEENPMLRFTVMVMVSSGQSFAKQAVVAINGFVLAYTISRLFKLYL